MCENQVNQSQARAILCAPSIAKFYNGGLQGRPSKFFQTRGYRLATSFDSIPSQNLRLSPLGIVPKRDGGWLLFHYLAYLANLSIKDFINLDFCSVTYQYASFDDVLSMICSKGKKCQSAKMDVKSVFRLLPVHPDDYQLLDF